MEKGLSAKVGTQGAAQKPWRTSFTRACIILLIENTRTDFERVHLLLGVDYEGVGVAKAHTLSMGSPGN